jgi:DNA-binding response OmpR family regulator
VGSKLILVVDREPDLASAIRGLVDEEVPAVVRVVESLVDARAFIQSLRPTLVLVAVGPPDALRPEVVRTPGTDGDSGQVPVVGFGAANQRASALAAGYDDYVERPGDLDHLIAVLRRWL